MISKAVIDRIVDSRHAVLLIGDDERELVIPSHLLPSGIQEGDWVKVTFDGENITNIEFDESETKKVRERVKSKLEQLRLRKRSNFRNKDKQK